MINKVQAFDKRFIDEEFVKEYERKHLKMQQKFGEEFTYKLKNRNFRGGRILDVGCAFGETVIFLSKACEDSSFTGIDISEKFIRRAKEKIERLGLGKRIHFLKADAHNLPFPNNYFDVIINTNMMHIVNNPVQMLNEMERVLSSDGIYFIADIKKSFLGLIEKEIKSAYSINEIRELIKKSNLREGVEQTSMLWWKYESHS